MRPPVEVDLRISRSTPLLVIPASTSREIDSVPV
jgi:hypothetical protein